MPLTPVVLEGRVVRLEPLTEAHIPALARVAFDPDLWAVTTTNLRDETDLRRYVDDAAALQRAGTALPFAIVLKETDTVVGSSRFGNYDAPHRKVEIGWSWVARPWQRTAVNPEAKLLMLRHAFEVIGCLRVEFKTDALNRQSQRALEKLGAVREGVLRSHMIVKNGPPSLAGASYVETGRRRDSVYYSILVEEWPAVGRALETRVEQAR